MEMGRVGSINQATHQRGSSVDLRTDKGHVNVFSPPGPRFMDYIIFIAFRCFLSKLDTMISIIFYTNVKVLNHHKYKEIWEKHKNSKFRFYFDTIFKGPNA